MRYDGSKSILSIYFFNEAINSIVDRIDAVRRHLAAISDRRREASQFYDSRIVAAFWLIARQDIFRDVGKGMVYTSCVTRREFKPGLVTAGFLATSFLPPAVAFEYRKPFVKLTFHSKCINSCPPFLSLSLPVHHVLHFARSLIRLIPQFPLAILTSLAITVISGLPVQREHILLHYNAAYSLNCVPCPANTGR